MLLTGSSLKGFVSNSRFLSSLPFFSSVQTSISIWLQANVHFSPYLHTPSSPDFSNSGNIRKHTFHSHKHTKYASFTAFLLSLHRNLKCSNRHTYSIRVQSTAGSFSTLCSKLTENLNNFPQIYHILQTCSMLLISNCYHQSIDKLKNMLTWLKTCLKYF